MVKDEHSKKLGDLVRAELNRKVKIFENNDSVELSKSQIIIKHIINNALKDEPDQKTLMSLLTMINKICPDTEEVAEHDEDKDQQIIERFLERKITDFLERNEIKLPKEKWK